LPAFRIGNSFRFLAGARKRKLFVAALGTDVEIRVSRHAKAERGQIRVRAA